MQHTRDHDRFKTFTDFVGSISKLGQRLATLEAEVVAIELLPVDRNGDAEALVNVGKSASLHIGLRLPPRAMLLAKSEEVSRAIETLKSDFNEILDHAAELAARCKPAPNTPVATPHLAIDLERMEREIKEMEITRSGPPRAHLSQVAEPLAPPLRPRIASPRLRSAAP